VNILVRCGEGVPGAYNPNKSHSQNDAALKKACCEFEAILIESIMKAMRKTVPRDGLFSGGFGEEVFQELFDQEIAGEMARCGRLGIADTLYNQLNAKKVYLRG
jgi:flagellar protein FlgJ